MDDALHTNELLDAVVANVLDHKQRREAFARELRAAAAVPDLAAWVARKKADEALEDELIPALASAGITLDAHVIKNLRAARAKKPFRFNRNVPPRGALEIARDALGSALGGLSRSNIAAREEVLRGREQPKAAVKTKTVAEALYTQMALSTPELLLTVLAALRDESRTAAEPHRWYERLLALYQQLDGAAREAR